MLFSNPAPRRMTAFLWAFVLTSLLASAFPPEAIGLPKTKPAPPCVSVEEAVQHLNEDLCVDAHVYDIVEVSDGTRFLDVCPPSVPDGQCKFTIVSQAEDRDYIGDIRRYRDRDVHVRGIFRPMHGRIGILLSHVRQFSGGPERFRPNPKLVRGFTGQTTEPPIRDPAVFGGIHRRSFMVAHDRERIPRR